MKFHSTIPYSFLFFDRLLTMFFILVFVVFCLMMLLRSTQGCNSKSSDTIGHAIPLLKNTFSFVFDGLQLLESVRRHLPGTFTIRIPIFRDDIYLVRGPKNCTEFFQSPHLIVTRAYSLVLQQCFGMKQRAVNAYIADTSGSRQNPIAGSSPSPQDRISYMTHENLVRGLLQEGLGHATSRFIFSFESSLEEERVMHENILGDSWKDEPDLCEFFQRHLGSSLIKSLFGDNLLEDNPEFMQDLWEYDRNAMKLAQRVPWFFLRNTSRARDRLKAAVCRWQEKSTSNDLKIHDFDDKSRGDAMWGTKMVRDRYYMLIKAAGQDEDSVASTNLALMWASVTNVVPSTTSLMLQICNSPSLLSTLQSRLSKASRPLSFKELESIPLLNSLYAETLRYGVQIHIPRTAPHRPIRLGGITIPEDKLIIANTWLSHTDEDVWNTKGGKHPLNEFWAERFLVDPNDETSGPVKHHNLQKPDTKDPYFSLDGLDGAWIPYGGGQHACPGRLLAKRIMLMSVALLIDKFQIELEQTKSQRSIEYGSDRFGFGVRSPKGPVQFRIRRRK